MPDVPAAVRAPRVKNPHGQYFTPANIAKLMVSMLATEKHADVLEPSAGEGVFVDALLEEGYINVRAVEIDETLLTDSPATVDHTSFVTWNPDYRCSAVIGNPPYIRWKHLGEAQKAELRSSPYWGTFVNSLSDYLTVFLIKSIQHLRPGGELVFVTPAFWMHTQHADPLRQFLLAHGAVTDLVTFGESTVFPGVSSSIIIFRFVKGGDAPTAINHYRYNGTRTVGSQPIALDSDRFTREEIPPFRPGHHWTIASAEVQARLSAFEQWTRTNPGPSTLGEVCDIANGMVSGLDRAFRLPEEVAERLTEHERAALINVAKASGLRPLTSNTLTAYIDLPAGLSEAEALEQYPNLTRHLATFREALEGRYSMKGTLPFWEWSFKRSEHRHRDGRRKVFVPCKERLTNRTHPRFSLVPVTAVPTQDVTSLTPKEDCESAEYVAAFLSLDEVADWVRHRGLMKGGVAEFSERPLAAMPFRSVRLDDAAEKDIHDRISAVVRSAEAGDISNVEGRAQVRAMFQELGLPVTAPAAAQS